MFFKSIELLIFIIIFTSCSSPTKVHKNIKLTNDLFELGGSSDNNSAGNLKTINFSVNSIELNDIEREKLKSNIGILKTNRNIYIQLEGHCDKRGSSLFNINLGKKRARKIKNILIEEGIANERISTISFGKEKPISFDQNEVGWAKNRRVNFTISTNQ